MINVKFKNNANSISMTSDILTCDVPNIKSGNFWTSQIARLSAFVILIFTFLFLYSANAQTSPQFLVSWQAESYAPSWYGGKVFPTQGTPVEIVFELVNNGKLVNISNNKVRWYVNGKLVKNEKDGLGIKSLRTIIQDYAGQETEIRITIADYPTGVIDKIIRIPVAKPEVVIDAPYPDRKISSGVSSFEALPFFFNVKNLSELSFEWIFNDKKSEQPAEEPQIFNLNVSSQLQSGTAGNLSVAVKNLLKELEFSSRGLQLQVR